MRVKILDIFAISYLFNIERKTKNLYNLLMQSKIFLISIINNKKFILIRFFNIELMKLNDRIHNKNIYISCYERDNI